MKHNIINLRNEKRNQEVADIEVMLSEEDIKNLDKGTGMEFVFEINKEIGKVVVKKEIIF